MIATIRDYHENDLDQLMAVWEAASALAHPFLPGDFVAHVREAIPTIYLPNAETWIAEVQGQVVGFIALLGHEVGALFVAPEHHGNGIGQQLMLQAQDQRGDLEVEVFEQNTIGCRFYRRYGFVETERNQHEESGCELVRFRLIATK